MYKFIIIMILLTTWVSGQTIVVDKQSKSSSGKGNLWHKGAADLLEYFLQEQGLKVVSRNQLDSLLDEQSITNSGLSAKESQKGKWLGADYILNGKAHKEASKVKVDISITRAANGQVLKRFTKYTDGEDTLALGLSELCRLITLEIENDSKASVKASAAKADDLFKSIDAQTLYEYYQAIRLIQSNQESAGIARLIYITANNPQFEMPFYWLRSFFAKYGYDKITRGLNGYLSIESFKELSKESNERRVVLNDLGELPPGFIKKITLLLNEIDFEMVNPASLKALDLEKSLQKWGYSVKTQQFADLLAYQASFVISVSSFLNDKYNLRIFNRHRAKEIIHLKNASENAMLEKMSQVLAKTEKFLVVQEEPEMSPLSDSVVYQQEESLLMKDLENLIRVKDVNNTLYKIGSGYCITDLLKNLCIEEILDRVQGEERPFWLSTKLVQNVGNAHDQDFNISRVKNYLKDIRESSTKSLGLKFALAFNEASLLYQDKNYQKSYEAFDALENNIQSYRLKSDFLNSTVLPSIHYWLWKSSVELGNEQHSKVWLLSLKEKAWANVKICHFIAPSWLVYHSHYISIAMPEKGWFTQEVKALENFSGERVWPALDYRKITEDSFQKCLEVIKLFPNWIRSSGRSATRNELVLKSHMFVSAVGHVKVNPFGELSAGLKGKCLSLIGLLPRSYALTLLCILEEHELAYQYIDSLRLSGSEKNTLKWLVKKTGLSHLQKIKLEAVQQMDGTQILELGQIRFCLLYNQL